MVPAARAATITGRYRTAMPPLSAPWPPSWACPPCWARQCGQRDLAMALIVARVARPGLEVGHHLTWWADTTLAVDLGVEGASTDDVYAAMDWLVGRQDTIEAELPGDTWHLTTGADGAVRPVELVGGRTCCPLAARGYSRDDKEGKAQIEYGLITDAAGRPVAVEVFAGNTADPTAFTATVAKVRKTFGLQEVVMVGDRGMITRARIDAIQESRVRARRGSAPCGPPPSRNWPNPGRCNSACSTPPTWPRSPHPDFPGERLIACKNPLLADRAGPETLRAARRHRSTPGPHQLRVHAGGLAGAGQDRDTGRQDHRTSQDGQTLQP